MRQSSVERRQRTSSGRGRTTLSLTKPLRRSTTTSPRRPQPARVCAQNRRSCLPRRRLLRGFSSGIALAYRPLPSPNGGHHLELSGSRYRSRFSRNLTKTPLRLHWIKHPRHLRAYVRPLQSRSLCPRHPRKLDQSETRRITRSWTAMKALW